jgi:hypothetical protein
MGVIRELSTGHRRLLEPEHPIGRAPTCALCLRDPYISAHHAVVRWTTEHWEVKDLGSRNGTFLDGGRLQPGEPYPMERGSRLGFGKLAQQWELADESSPSVMVVPLDGRDPLLVENDLIALPSGDDPQGTIYQSEGLWLLEKADEPTAPIANQETFEVAGCIWRFCCPQSTSKTWWLTGLPSGMEVRHLEITLSLSRDGEETHLDLGWAGRMLDMGTRAHNALLLAMARRRLEDAAAGLSESSCGWMYQEDLTDSSHLDVAQLNSDVFRIRKQFAAAGVLDAVSIIERRPRTRQLRIGTGRISIVEP